MKTGPCCSAPTTWRTCTTATCTSTLRRCSTIEKSAEELFPSCSARLRSWLTTRSSSPEKATGSRPGVKGQLSDFFEKTDQKSTYSALKASLSLVKKPKHLLYRTTRWGTDSALPTRLLAALILLPMPAALGVPRESPIQVISLLNAV